MVATHPTRKPLRLREFNYSSNGAYSVTIVAHERAELFGAIANDVVVANPAGVAVTDAWNTIPERFPTVELDAFMLMPNHMHGILWLLDEPSVSGVEGAASSAPTTTDPRRPALGTVMRAFKSISAREVNRIDDRTGSVWQRNYFETIVHNQKQLDALRQYIEDNPLKWALDEENKSKR